MTLERRPDTGVSRSRAQHLHTNRWPIAAVLGVVVLLVWPLQTILAAVLVATVFLLLGVSGLWTRRHVHDRPHRRVVDDRVRDIAFAGLALGLVLVVVWPVMMAIATLAVALVASVAWGIESWSEYQFGGVAAHDEPVGVGEAPPAVVEPPAAPVPTATTAPSAGPRHRAARPSALRRTAQPAGRTTRSPRTRSPADRSTSRPNPGASLAALTSNHPSQTGRTRPGRAQL